MEIGFSLYGLILVLISTVPNVFFLFFPPVTATIRTQDAGVAASLMEHGGRIFYFASMICLTYPYYRPTLRSFLILALVICSVLYVLVWVLYFTHGMDYTILSRRVLGFLIPLAVLPSAYTILSALWLRNYTATVFAAIFSIGHMYNYYLGNIEEQDLPFEEPADTQHRQQ